MLSRREFLQCSAVAMLSSGCNEQSDAHYSVPGKLLGAPAALGHRLRIGDFPPPSSSRNVRIVIAGGGIAGLAAAYQLQRLGIDDVLVLDMLERPGGNSSYGTNSVSAYPWGAHYVPLVRSDCTPVIELFKELGIITGFDAQARPIYNEFFLSADPQERLLMYGKWQDGLVPAIGASARDQEQYAKFFARVEQLKQARGRDGKPLFAIPVDASSSDAEWRVLDRITMSDYMHREGFDSPLLSWYVNYCCRDDYGATMQQVSAWAALHYFAARNGIAANADSSTVITWPEGNGYLVRELETRSRAEFKNQAVVTRVERSGTGVAMNYFDAELQQCIRVDADIAIVCLPHFVASRVVEGLSVNDAAAFTYAPWMVANLTLDKLPLGRGQPLAWDNVVFNSELLGYVDATHQRLEQARRETVLTYYWPLSHAEPKEAREQALQRSIDDWQALVLRDLYRAHPELVGHVTNMDAWVWGHGMIRPTPGFIWGEARQQAAKHRAPIFFAHSDLSGVSIFEEAYCRGVDAAQAAVGHLMTKHTQMQA